VLKDFILPTFAQYFQSSFAFIYIHFW